MWWFVYIVRCADDTLYTGATNDVAARVAKHNTGKGARYTRSRLPVALVWKKRVSGKSAALKLEYQVKQLSRREKAALAESKHRKDKRRPLVASSRENL